MTTSTEAEVRRIKFFVYGKGTFGNGETFDEAIKNHRDAGGDRYYVVYMWTGDEYPHKAWGHAFGFNWEGTMQSPVLIQDKRNAADRKSLPLVIGQSA